MSKNEPNVTVHGMILDSAAGHGPQPAFLGAEDELTYEALVRWALALSGLSCV